MRNSAVEIDVEVDSEEVALEEFLSLIERGESPNSALAKTCAAFPQHAEFLADYALISTFAAVETAGTEHDTLFEQRLVEIAEKAQRRKLSGILARIRELGQSPEQFSRSLKLDTSIVTKLDRRLIELKTIPNMLLDRLADSLQVSLAAVQEYLQLMPTLSPNADYKSGKRPSAIRKESFAKAIATSLSKGHIGQDDASYWTENQHYAE